MSRYRLAEPAEEDLRAIAEYLSSVSLEVANKFCLKLAARFELLSKFPFQSAIDPRLDGTTRMALVKPYQIFYRPTEDGVDILRIIHGARDLQALLDNEKS